MKRKMKKHNKFACVLAFLFNNEEVVCIGLFLFCLISLFITMAYYIDHEDTVPIMWAFINGWRLFIKFMVCKIIPISIVGAIGVYSIVWCYESLKKWAKEHC